MNKTLYGAQSYGENRQMGKIKALGDTKKRTSTHQEEVKHKTGPVFDRACVNNTNLPTPQHDRQVNHKLLLASRHNRRRIHRCDKERGTEL